MGITYSEEDNTWTIECDWPGCGAKDTFKSNSLPKDYGGYLRYWDGPHPDDDPWCPELPGDGVLCQHHAECREAMHAEDVERFMRLIEL